MANEPEYLTRMRTEYAENEQRLFNGHVFINSDKSNELDEIAYMLLANQLDVMHMYSRILKTRIEHAER